MFAESNVDDPNYRMLSYAHGEYASVVEWDACEPVIELHQTIVALDPPRTLAQRTIMRNHDRREVMPWLLAESDRVEGLFDFKALAEAIRMTFDQDDPNWFNDDRDLHSFHDPFQPRIMEHILGRLRGAR